LHNCESIAHRIRIRGAHADCSKSLTDLSLGDAWQCFKNADDWATIGGNIRRMWDGFTVTTSVSG
jgi:hypothetical protein